MRVKNLTKGFVLTDEMLKSNLEKAYIEVPKKNDFMNWCVCSGIDKQIAEGIYTRYFGAAGTVRREKK